MVYFSAPEQGNSMPVPEGDKYSVTQTVSSWADKWTLQNASIHIDVILILQFIGKQ